MRAVPGAARHSPFSESDDNDNEPLLTDGARIRKASCSCLLIALGAFVIALGILGELRRLQESAERNRSSVPDQPEAEATSVNCRGLFTHELATCIKAAAVHSPYRYNDYKKAVAQLDGETLGASSDVQKTPDVVRDSVHDLVLKNQMRKYLPFERAALKYEKMTNRYYFLEDELESGRYWMTMSTTMQSLALMVVLSEVEGKNDMNIVFAGCGLGDWAAETALAVGATSKVWCFNRAFAVMEMSRNILTSHAIHDLFDSSLMTRAQWEAANAIHKGSKLLWSCGEPSKPECMSPEGLLTSQIHDAKDYMGGQFDVIVYGNALQTSELTSVRDSLKPKGFALVPVCTTVPRQGSSGGAAWYCSGRWWKIFARDSTAGDRDEGLWTFKATMRPIGAQSDVDPSASTWV